MSFIGGIFRTYILIGLFGLAGAGVFLVVKRYPDALIYLQCLTVPPFLYSIRLLADVYRPQRAVAFSGEELRETSATDFEKRRRGLNLAGKILFYLSASAGLIWATNGFLRGSPSRQFMYFCAGAPVYFFGLIAGFLRLKGWVKGNPSDVKSPRREN